jgi:uncharacterized protein YecE (DUF72 family)
MKTDQYLPYYARHFHSVELNNSFYKLPTVETLAAWRDASPPGFCFAVKGSRYITHMKKLKLEEGHGLFPLLERVDVLGDKLGPLLFQLPPRWRYNGDRLAAFVAALPPQHRYAFELRDVTWMNEEAYDILRSHRMAYCIYDLSRFLSPEVVTADFVYIRLHGPGEAYQGSYDTGVLAYWADKCIAWAAEGRDVYCYFDNDQAGYAVHDALRLQALVEVRAKTVSLG